MKNITILGTGYVGLVSGAGISDFGNQVICADIIKEKIKSLRNGKIPIYVRSDTNLSVSITGNIHPAKNKGAK